MLSPHRPRGLEKRKAPTAIDLKMGEGIRVPRSWFVLRPSLHLTQASCINPFRIGKLLEGEEFPVEEISNRGG